jgi:TATA-box binding protein (TBP) (component of TFIID and TFIIIB)
MYLLKTQDYTIVAFKNSKKCRIMGKKIPPNLPMVKLEHIQTMSASHDLKFCLHLNNLSKELRNRGVKIEYEPEIFPALRLLEYDPVCVNMFSSGKITLLGLKSELQGREIIQSLIEVGIFCLNSCYYKS